MIKIIVCALACTSPLRAAQLLVGDSNLTQVSFPFQINTHGFALPQGLFFVGARDAVSQNTFSVAVVGRGEIAFRGITPPFVKFDGVPKISNPLYGAGISKMAMLGARPLVALKGNPSALFLLEPDGKTVYSAQNIQNGKGAPAKSLLHIATTAPQIMVPLEGDASLGTVAALGNDQGGFDGNGSGIALLFFKKFIDAEKKQVFKWDIVNALTGSSQYSPSGELTSAGNRAYPVDTTTPALALTNPVSALGSDVEMHFDRELGRLYIAMNVTAGAGASDGARAVMVGSLTQGRLALSPIAPDSAFAGDQIIGTRGPLSKATIYKVRTMQTRTHLRYLVVVGGTGGSDDLRSRVFALPLVDNIKAQVYDASKPAEGENVKPSIHGTLANVNSLPVTIFGAGSPQSFQARVFSEPATSPDQLYSMSSPTAAVGGQALLPGPITDIVVRGDAVFVSTEAAGNGLEPGIFFSQALFDTTGRISGWTNWRRAAAGGEAVREFTLDSFTGSFWYMPVSNSTVQSVFRTTWTNGSDDLGSFMVNEFNFRQGGVQGLFDFPFTTPSFSTTINNRISVQAMTGYKKVVLLQTGADSGGFFGPATNLTAYHSTDGTLSQFQGAPALSLSGGVLDQLGPLNSAVVLTDGVDGWFIVGGSCGVAILADEQGHGWSASEGLGYNFKGLLQTMAWRKLSDAPVRKLIASGNNLFILTTRSLERLTITAQSLANPEPTVLTHLDDELASYSDLLVSGPLALIATSKGLFRSGNYVNVQSAANSIPLVQVDLPESAGPVTRLQAISSTNEETDVGMNGNVYVLSACVGLSQAQIYRLVIAAGSVTDETVQLFPDYYIRGVKTYFASLGDYRNYVVTDGALIALSRSAFGGAHPFMELLSPTLKSGEINGARVRITLLVLPSPFVSLSKLIRSSASGAWMVPGDFGLRIQG